MSKAQPQCQLLEFRARAADTGRMPQYDNPDLNPLEQARRVNNLARLGRVHSVRLTKPPRCRVQTGDNITDWIPWFAVRAGGKEGSTWWPPVLGEQAMVFSVGGDMGQGVALLGVYSDEMEPPSYEPDTCRLQYSEEDYSETAKGQHLLHMEKQVRFEVADGCSITMGPDSITLQAGGATLHIGPGEITSNVDVIAGGISHMEHVHGGVRRGDSDTDGPK
ncbi:phage baseplate assembly protein V [Comamonas odontotermitis]|uniref:phage baseplate assembly protein V n=1 Tax=Comamonas odontotermitis TaxID=379895 RepID=UPI00366B2805